MLKVGKSQTLGSILVIKDGAVRIPQREAVSALCRGADKLSFPQKVGRAFFFRSAAALFGALDTAPCGRLRRMRMLWKALAARGGPPRPLHEEEAIRPHRRQGVGGSRKRQRKSLRGKGFRGLLKRIFTWSGKVLIYFYMYGRKMRTKTKVAQNTYGESVKCVSEICHRSTENRL